jgi:probable phosphoglycerate mutase
MKLVLIRHGETEWSRDKRHTSRTDLPLTDVGREQARAVGPLIAGRAFALVLVSPRLRARETAELAGLPATELDDDLVEWDYGDYEGRTTADIRKERPGWELWRDGCPGGEPIEHVGERADRAIERAKAAGGDVAIVAHGHFLRVLGARWIGLAANMGGTHILGTGTLSELGFERERQVIRTWNAR